MTDVVPAEGARLERILDETYDLWHEGLSRRAYGQYYDAQRRTPWGAARLHRFALVDGGDILASAKTYEFDATLDGRTVRVLGLGAVFASPAHRGRGYAPALIERLLERATAEGADLALLFSEIRAGYYERLGFERVPAFDVEVRVANPPHRGAPAVLVRAGDDRDVADVAAMWTARAAGYRFHLNRDRELVRYAIAKKRLLAGLAPAGLRTTQFFVAEEGASAVAYVLLTERARDGGREWTLQECGDRDPSGARVGAILQVLIAREPGAQRPRVRGWMPPRMTPPQVTVAARTPAADVMMMRPLSERGRVSPPLEARDVLYCRSDYF